jgi:hypothetical protein
VETQVAFWGPRRLHTRPRASGAVTNLAQEPGVGGVSPRPSTEPLAVPRLSESDAHAESAAESVTTGNTPDTPAFDPAPAERPAEEPAVEPVPRDVASLAATPEEAQAPPSGEGTKRTYFVVCLCAGLAVAAAGGWLLLRRRSGG